MEKTTCCAIRYKYQKIKRQNDFDDEKKYLGNDDSNTNTMIPYYKKIFGIYYNEGNFCFMTLTFICVFFNLFVFLSILSITPAPLNEGIGIKIVRGLILLFLLSFLIILCFGEAKNQKYIFCYLAFYFFVVLTYDGVIMYALTCGGGF